MSPGTNISPELSYEGKSPATAQDPDAALVASARRGDLDAFEGLIARHQKRMLNIAFRLIGNYDDACEVVQDVFVSAYRNLGTFRGDAKFTTWLTSITLNLSKNRVKQLHSRRGHEAFSIDEPVETDEGPMAIDPPSNERSALDMLEQRDVQARVQDCIKALEPDFREALVLRDLQEFSYEEIGDMLKVRPGTVKSRISRAREMVKECLKRLLGEL